MKAKKFVRVQQFQGMPKESDFRIEEEELPPLKEHDYLCQAVYWSVDPYMRAYAPMRPTGNTMFGTQVAKVIESNSLQFPVGSYVVGDFGWRTHTIVNAQAPPPADTLPTYAVPELKGFPMSLYLGILGMPGNTAYFGFTECCQPKPGETVVVTGAAGAVGSHVGQIAKILGCSKVIGVCGSDQKGEWLKTIGYDDYINYKTVKNFRVALNEKLPNGVDCYFDNVGGEISSMIMVQMNKYGRVGVCGSISSYNEDISSIPKATILQPSIVFKLLTVKGLHASEYVNKWITGIKQNREWLEAGKLVYKETVTEGFENIPKALIGMLKGENTGKAVVKA